MQNVHVVIQDLTRATVVTFNQRFHFLVDDTSRFIGHMFRFRDGAAQEHLTLFLCIQQRTEFVGEAPLSHHVTCQVCRHFNVVRRTGRNMFRTINNLFRQTTAVQG